MHVQCIQGLTEGSLRRILLTASGGAFRYVNNLVYRSQNVLNEGVICLFMFGSPHILFSLFYFFFVLLLTILSCNNLETTPSLFLFMFSFFCGVDVVRGWGVRSYLYFLFKHYFLVNRAVKILFSEDTVL